MRVPGAKTLTRIARPLLSTVRPGGLILGYHRVAEMPWDPLDLAVGVKRFAEQLQELLETCTLVSVRSLVEAAARSDDVVGMAALTFDDGYGDFMEHALPALEEHRVPATMFAATGYIGRPYWWDEVASAFDPALQARSRFTLRWNENSHFQGSCDSSEAAHTVRRVCQALECLDEDHRAPVIEQCRAQVAQSANSRPKDLGLSVEQLRLLAQHPLIEIGSHGVSHARLDELAVDEQRYEMQASRRRLEGIAGTGSVLGLAYPHGACGQRAPVLAAESGYAYACASQPGLVRGSVDRYRLPRVWVPDVGGAKFRKWLRPWCGWR
jgi:peptidoglycan/xylan/chitin deacetylase (PgdA/CDA1 family)